MTKHEDTATLSCVGSSDVLERKRYTLWTNPMENWTRCFDGIEFTQEVVAAVEMAMEKVDRKKIDERTKPYRGNSYFAL